MNSSVRSSSPVLLFFEPRFGLFRLLSASGRISTLSMAACWCVDDVAMTFGAIDNGSIAVELHAQNDTKKQLHREEHLTCTVLRRTSSETEIPPRFLVIALFCSLLIRSPSRFGSRPSECPYLRRTRLHRNEYRVTSKSRKDVV